MCDISGTELTVEDKEILAHPLVGGVILFSQNYQDPAQLIALTNDIKKASKRSVLLAVDHEGGRVQRFREQFTQIPPMAEIWYQGEENLTKAQLLAKQWGETMAREVLAVGIDISFAPVLDVQGICEVIGDRAFHQDPEIISALGGSFIDGMHQAGMKATGKHFPGHGSVKEDSHVDLPIDKRGQQAILEHDLLPFKQLIQAKKLDAMMPAHIIFPEIDQHAVGFSPVWLQQILRQQLGFNGVIFSDDLTMQGAAYIGGYCERAEAAQQAGCDMLLVCNSREATIDIIDHANISVNALSHQRLEQLIAHRV
jgi:beta-N-acetylhexosaminidase